MIQKKHRTWLIHFLICLTAALLVSLPLANGTVAMGSDTSFHIDRIEALHQAMEEGILYPKIFWNQNYGYGYGSPLFYSDFFLIIPAWFRHLGMGILPAYRLFLFVVFFFQAVFMCRLASDVIRKNYLSTAAAVLMYVFSSYLFTTIYNRGALGEAQAAVFVPVVLHGIYRIFYRKSDYRAVFELMLGFSGLLLSHNITFFLMEIWFVIWCLVHIRRILKEKKILVLLLTAEFGAFLLTAWFSLPMLEQLQTKVYRISSYFNDAQTLTEHAVWLKDIFTFFPYNHDLLEGANGLGETILPFMIIFLPKRKRGGFALEMAVSGYVLLWMTTAYFPWRLFPFMSFLQFPHRLFIVNSAMLALSAGYVFAWFPVVKSVHREASMTICGLLLVTMFLQINSQFNYKGVYTDDTPESVYHDATVYFPDVDNWYNVAEISSPDYLPANTEIVYTAKRIIRHGDMNDSVFDEDISTMSWHYDGGGEYCFPKTWYKGMRVSVEDNGRELLHVPTKRDEKTGCVLFELPDDLPSDSRIVLYYEGTILQKITRLVSIVSASVLTISYILLAGMRRKRKRGRRK